MVSRIDNQVKCSHHLPPGRPAKVDLRLQFLLGGHDALHGAGQCLAVSATARCASQSGRGFAGPGALGL